jgi:hypothetical protein
MIGAMTWSCNYMFLRSLPHLHRFLCHRLTRVFCCSVDFEALVASRSNTSDPALTLRNVALQNSWQVLSLLYKTTLHPTSQALTRVCREHFNFSAQQNFGAAGDRNLKPKSPNKIPKYQTSNQRRSLAKLLVLDRFCEWLLRNASASTGASAHAPRGRLCVTMVSAASKTKSRRMRMLQVVLRLSFAALPAPAFSRLLFNICPRKFCVLTRSIDVVPLPLPGLVSCLRAHL